jgi:dipeptidyl aminopeptidase/acylaminoacyl peptidase
MTQNRWPARFIGPSALIIIVGISAAGSPAFQTTSAQTAARQEAAKERQNRGQELIQLQNQIREMQGRVRELQNQGMEGRHQADLDEKKTDDALLEKLCREAGMAYTKAAYPSPADGLSIPTYLFRSSAPAGPKSKPALLWIHPMIHGSFDSDSFLLVQEAVRRGYVVLAPEYRGSIGYGKVFYEAIDYGGYEVDDVMGGCDFLKANVPEVDPARIGMIGWSHGGFITLHSLIRDQGRTLKCAYAGVPVTNLVFRLSFKGPYYEAEFARQKRIGGEVYEKRDIYIERSPVYHVSKIKVPVRVHVATNDQDVNFVECEMLIHALEYHIPRLAETKIYVDPPGGHDFERLLTKDRKALQNTPAQRDSLNLIWAFLEEHLQPYLLEIKR